MSGEVCLVGCWGYIMQGTLGDKQRRNERTGNFGWVLEETCIKGCLLHSHIQNDVYVKL